MKIDVNRWSRIAEVDAYAYWRGIDTATAIHELVNHALSDERVMPTDVRSAGLRHAHALRTLPPPPKGTGSPFHDAVNNEQL